MTDTSVSPIHKLVIGDPAGGSNSALLTALASKSNDGMLGGMTGLLPLLIGAFLFGGRGGRGGLFGGDGVGGGGGDAVALASIMTPKDVSQQLTTFQSWAANNATQLATQICGIDKSICSSSRDIIAAVSALTPQMYQGFAAQAMQSCQQAAALEKSISGGFAQTNENLGDAINDTHVALERGIAASALAECQTQNLINTSSCDTRSSAATQFAALSRQLAECCCENRLAICNQNALIERNTAQLQNQINIQTCEIKQAISTDGQATRALIQANQLDELRQQLADAKTASVNAGLLAQIQAAVQVNTQTVNINPAAVAAAAITEALRVSKG